MNTLILYFSGTGNTKYIAEEISAHMHKLESATEIHSTEEIFQIKPNTFDMLILGCPKYYEYPILDFLQYLKDKLPVNSKNIPVMMFCTQAGPLKTDYRKIEKILKSKNYTLKVSKSFAVANNMVIFESFELTEKEKLQANLDNINKELRPLLSGFVSGKENIEKPNILYGVMCYMVAVVCTKLFPVFALKYSASDDCTSCGLCAAKCPKHNIKLHNKKPKFDKNCIFCMRCINICPHNAILYSDRKCKQYKQIDNKN